MWSSQEYELSCLLFRHPDLLLERRKKYIYMLQEAQRRDTLNLSALKMTMASNAVTTDYINKQWINAEQTPKTVNTGLQWGEKIKTAKITSSGEQAASNTKLISNIHLPQTTQYVNKCMAQEENMRKHKESWKTPSSPCHDTVTRPLCCWCQANTKPVVPPCTFCPFVVFHYMYTCFLCVCASIYKLMYCIYTSVLAWE